MREVVGVCAFVRGARAAPGGPRRGRGRRGRRSGPVRGPGRPAAREGRIGDEPGPGDAALPGPGAAEARRSSAPVGPGPLPLLALVGARRGTGLRGGVKGAGILSRRSEV